MLLRLAALLLLTCVASVEICAYLLARDTAATQAVALQSDPTRQSMRSLRPLTPPCMSRCIVQLHDDLLLRLQGSFQAVQDVVGIFFSDHVMKSAVHFLARSLASGLGSKALWCSRDRGSA
jgi:hypothetical protein